MVFRWIDLLIKHDRILIVADWYAIYRGGLGAENIGFDEQGY